MFLPASRKPLLIILVPAFLLNIPVFSQDQPAPSSANVSFSQTQTTAAQDGTAVERPSPSPETAPAAQNKPAPAKPADTASPQAQADNTEELRKAVQNPVASLISVPIQYNANFRVGQFNRVQTVLNIQPVIPMRISENWNLILRIIQPIISQPDPNSRNLGTFGLGDMNPSFFFSPAHPGKLIWGVGPTVVIPTATDKTLGQGKLSFGPTVVALVQPEHWTIGVLANNVWSVAGSGGRPAVNQFLLQYFLNYNLEKGYYITLQPIITANWRAPSGEKWTVPFGGGVGRIMKLGYQPVNITGQVYWNAVRPTDTSPLTLRLQIAFLFPKRPKKP
jgi:hypothetical protein